MERLKIVGRWIAVVPGAFGIAFLLYIFFRFMWALAGAGHWIIAIFSGGLLGFMAPLVAAFIAPNHKQNTGMAIAIIALLFAGGMLFNALRESDGSMAVEGLGMAIGAAIAAYKSARGELDT